MLRVCYYLYSIRTSSSFHRRHFKLNENQSQRLKMLARMLMTDFFYTILVYTCSKDKRSDKEKKAYKIIDDKVMTSAMTKLSHGRDNLNCHSIAWTYYYYNYYWTLAKLTVICGYFVSGQ